MGSITRSNRAVRFINEFNEDARKRWDMSEFPCCLQQSLGFDESYEVVRVFYRFVNREREEELCTPFVVYDPEWRDEEAIDIVRDTFGLEDEEAERRMKKVLRVEVKTP